MQVYGARDMCSFSTVTPFGRKGQTMDCTLLEHIRHSPSSDVTLHGDLERTENAHGPQCGIFPGIGPKEQSRGVPKTIKIGIHTKNTGINSYKTCAVNAAPRGAPWGSVGAPWGPLGPRPRSPKR